MIGGPASESQGRLEDVEERAFRPKVPKPPNRTALAANRNALNTLFLEDQAKDPALAKVLQSVGLDGTKPILHSEHPVVVGMEWGLPLCPPTTSVRSVLHDISKQVNAEFSSMLGKFVFPYIFCWFIRDISYILFKVLGCMS